MTRQHQQGFTLIEIMMVVVIVAILAAIAYPSYQEHVRSARRADAQAVLLQAAQFLERFHTVNARYDKTKPGGVDVALPADLTASPSGSANSYYTIAIQDVTASSYVLQATPVAGSSQEYNGFLQYTSAGVRSWDRDNSGTVDAGESCWTKTC